MDGNHERNKIHLDFKYVQEPAIFEAWQLNLFVKMLTMKINQSLYTQRMMKRHMNG